MRIIKKVIQIGNGAAVYVPKELSGHEVTIIIPEGIEEIKKRVLTGLIKFMPNIIGIYLFGSYAREEQEAGSDIDVLVITKEKDNKIKEAIKDVDLWTAPLDSIKKTLENSPLFIAPLIRDAKTLLNPILLDELKQIKIDFRKFKWNFEESESAIKIVESFVDVDPEDISASLIYTLMLRLKTFYAMECLLKDRKYSTSGVKELLLKYDIKKDKIDKYFTLYRLTRDDEETNEKIEEKEMRKLIKITKDYIKKVKNETKKKIDKRY